MLTSQKRCSESKLPVDERNVKAQENSKRKPKN